MVLERRREKVTETERDKNTIGNRGRSMETEGWKEREVSLNCQANRNKKG